MSAPLVIAGRVMRILLVAPSMICERAYQVDYVRFGGSRRSVRKSYAVFLKTLKSQFLLWVPCFESE